MANTFTALHYHVIFSTKDRRPWITPDIESRVWEYLGGIARDNRLVALRVGGIEDHIHAVLALPPAVALSKAVQLLKGGSSKWIHDTFPGLAEFGWQDGYSAYTVSKSALTTIIEYVANQRKHHHTMTFQEEYRAFLDKHGIAYDERYVW